MTMTINMPLRLRTEHTPQMPTYQPQNQADAGPSTKISVNISMPRSAVDNVLENSELLANILSSLNSRTLLHCSGVNRTWLKTISNSAQSRRNLWIQPPTQPGRFPRPYLNPFFTYYYPNLAINAWVKREYSDATDYVIRFACKNKLAMLGRGSWRDMLVFWPSERAVGELIVQVEDEDTPCVYDVFPMTMDWSQTVTLGALVDLILAS
ncbi:hypothetical protein CB0940_07111 [Cercospora beticola]|uniref:Uncharacterized protein n=1 Tax=Cercospora beticola TaxID=122368 RepID=A0A2G5HAS6_CERBT|nr:hypothetical protein CB0940_07111 [Cercospora beticola]PIA89631.1 hypothetical protein CB0940_07111 [Cercospora beticola]WPB03036.1 hypothetical protein RHO25_007673 [Cercospora beticola]